MAIVRATAQGSWQRFQYTAPSVAPQVGSESTPAAAPYGAGSAIRRARADHWQGFKTVMQPPARRPAMGADTIAHLIDIDGQDRALWIDSRGQRGIVGNAQTCRNQTRTGDEADMRIPG